LSLEFGQFCLCEAIAQTPAGYRRLIFLTYAYPI
jgi:hypothetical protein